MAYWINYYGMCQSFFHIVSLSFQINLSMWYCSYLNILIHFISIQFFICFYFLGQMKNGKLSSLRFYFSLLSIFISPYFGFNKINILLNPIFENTNFQFDECINERKSYFRLFHHFFHFSLHTVNVIIILAKNFQIDRLQ